jgi:hypothetical protein
MCMEQVVKSRRFARFYQPYRAFTSWTLPSRQRKPNTERCSSQLSHSLPCTGKNHYSKCHHIIFITQGSLVSCKLEVAVTLPHYLNHPQQSHLPLQSLHSLHQCQTSSTLRCVQRPKIIDNSVKKVLKKYLHAFMHS